LSESTDDGEYDDNDSSDDYKEAPRRSGKRFTLIFDVVRRFAQLLGINLPEWEGRITETEKGIVRLLRVVEHSRQLFGENGAASVAAELERGAGHAAQFDAFPR
jgi:putative DNA methylase